ncbi:MAG: PIN domain-containing protein [bacterium]|nr:PIN domain-containing protein [bacterium]
MKTVFLDASVLVAACASKTGASAFILGYSQQRKVKCFISPEVIGEAKKNIRLKLKESGEERLEYYLKTAGLQLVGEPTLTDIVRCEGVIIFKDAHVLAAAIKSEAGYLITLDRKHFFTPEVISFSRPLKIITPGEFVIKILSKG